MDGVDSFRPIVAVVDFHHQRGPEVERWVGVEQGHEHDWHLLPFLALSDGAHAATEDFSYFTLVLKSTPEQRSLFGISCTRQINARDLVNKSADVTRSTVQKAIVVITENPQTFGAIREKLSVVTKAWFAQRDFGDIEILQRFQESLNSQEDDENMYFGLSMRELIHQFKWQTLVLFKCMLLQPKMLFFGSNCERMCLIQFSLISLIPNLMRHLRDCADPRMDYYASHLEKPTSLKTSQRASLLAYMGVPLQIFGKGSLFGPYTPLQQLDTLADQDTKSYMVGSTNQLLLQQRDRYADVLVNLDDNTIAILSPSLRTSLALSTADRRWIDFLTQSVHDTWDENIPSRPKDMGYAGSEEFIRLQFEEYLLALLSCSKYSTFLSIQKENNNDAKTGASPTEPDPSSEFNSEFIHHWRTRTENHALFHRTTDSHLFDVIAPRHPCAGALTIEDVQRRVAAQVSELHLDEKWKGGKEAVGKHLNTGREKVAGAINGLWADLEGMRELQRLKRGGAAGVDEQAKTTNSVSTAAAASDERKGTATVTAAAAAQQAQAAAQAASSRAGAYLSSWGSWASEKRRNWAKPDDAAATTVLATHSSLRHDTTVASTEMWAVEEHERQYDENEVERERLNIGGPMLNVESTREEEEEEEEEEEDVQRIQQEDIASQMAAQDPWAAH